MSKQNYSEWTKQELIKEIKKLKKRKKYGIVWEDKPEKVAELCKEKLPVLEEDKSKEIKTDENKPINILIEGDNYHALSVLNYTHKGKIDVIYIDPPYNTGRENFRYNDKIVGEEDAYRHSKWLSFMSKRLKLAKNLLKKDGVILVNIGDDELAQLKLLMDEIFGEKNFRNIIIWAYRTGGAPHKNEAFSKKHDYILFYSKSSKYFFKRFKERVYYEKDFFGAKRDTSKRQCKDLTEKEKKKIIQDILKGINLNNKYKEILFDKYYADVNLRDIIEGKMSLIKDGKVYREFNTKPVLNLSSERVENFLTQKPIGLLEFLFEVFSRENAVILDFFAGSGSTGHAILHMNKVYGGKRKFILCTNNEDNICTETCYPRLKMAIKGHPKHKNSIWGLGGNLKYFKTDFVDAEPTDLNKKKLVDKSTEMLCLKEDCFNLVKEAKHFRIFKNPQGKYLGIIYDDEGIEPFKKEVKKLKKKFVVYVFSLDESAREEEFEDVAEMVELKPIPAVILNVYRRIFR